MNDSRVIEHYQHQLMSTIDQFDDPFEYISFKEAQTEIIRRVGDTVRVYMMNKDSMIQNFLLLQIPLEIIQLSEHMLNTNIKI